MSLSPCRQLISCTAVPSEPTLNAVRILLPTSIQRQMKTVSGVRFVLPVLHRDAGDKNVVGIWEISSEWNTVD